MGGHSEERHARQLACIHEAHGRVVLQCYPTLPIEERPAAHTGADTAAAMVRSAAASGAPPPLGDTPPVYKPAPAASPPGASRAAAFAGGASAGAPSERVAHACSVLALALLGSAPLAALKRAHAAAKNASELA